MWGRKYGVRFAVVDALARHGHLTLTPDGRDWCSAPAPRPSIACSRRRVPPQPVPRADARATSRLRKQVPVRTAADWNDPLPRYLEIDLATHCGERAAGRFVHTLTLTDIATGGTACVARATVP